MQGFWGHPIELWLSKSRNKGYQAVQGAAARWTTSAEHVAVTVVAARGVAGPWNKSPWSCLHDIFKVATGCASLQNW